MGLVICACLGFCVSPYLPIFLCTDAGVAVTAEVEGKFTIRLNCKVAVCSGHFFLLIFFCCSRWCCCCCCCCCLLSSFFFLLLPSSSFFSYANLCLLVPAGALNTPLVLKRSKLVNHHIGSNLRLHPVSVVFGT